MEYAAHSNFHSALDSTILEMECHFLLAQTQLNFENYWLQIGGNISPPLFKAIQLNRRIWTDTKEGSNNKFNDGYYVRSNPDQLPFLLGSLELVVAWHLLESNKNFQAILKEVFDILSADGHLIIFSFNPISLLGLKKLLQGKTAYFSAFKIMRALKKIGFKNIKCNKIFYRLPCDNIKVLQVTRFLESFGSLFFALFGGINVIEAEKKVNVLTPVQLPVLERDPKLVMT